MDWRGIPPEYQNQIVTGDARELAKRIPDESVDLIFTDPPYPKEYLYTFEWIAREAKRILKRGGSILCLSGQAHFDKVFGYFAENLDYYWMNCYYTMTVTQVLTFWPKKIFARWKPILWFTKGERDPEHFIQDGVSSSVSDKRFHHWGQTEQWAFYWIDQLSKKTDIIFEPYAGGGTVPAVCKMLGRNYIAFEIDPATADRARERVRLTQPPLFVPEPVQGALFGDG